MLLAVWIAVPVVCLLALGVLGYGVLGALQRLGREARALEREVAPLLAQAQAVQARAGAAPGEEPAGHRSGPGPVAFPA